MSVFSNFSREFATGISGTSMKDFKHASRLFVDGNYALSPKYDFLFHVFFDLNPQVSSINDIRRQFEHGMLVKSIDLPKFTIENKTLNNYNRPNLIQTKLRHEGININFHDDQSNVIRNLWFDYYNYYYRDADLSYSDSSGSINPAYYAKKIYDSDALGLNAKFGYTPRSPASNVRYINAIRIYSLHKKQFSEYTIINPIITSFGHGSHATNSNSGLEHAMSIQYETVLYCSGFVTKSTVKGFADLHYDKSPSPITVFGGGGGNIFGQGGIASAIDTAIRLGGSGTVGGALGGIFVGAMAWQNNKNINLAGAATNELNTGLKDILEGRDPRNRFFTPYPGAAQSSAGAPPGLGAGIPGVGSGSVFTNGASAGLTGLAVAGASVFSQVGKPSTNSALTGVATNASGQVSGAGVNQVLSVNKSGDVTAAAQQVNPSFFGSVLNFFQKSKAAQVQSENTTASVASASNSAAVAPTNASVLNAIQSGSVQSGIPVFSSGTNNVVGGSLNANQALQQTPYAQSVAFTGSGVASGAAANFVNNGATVNLTPPGTSIPGNNNPVTI